ncbi:MAG: S8 family serine peptidase [Planctomycetota bacterium]
MSQSTQQNRPLDTEPETLERCQRRIALSASSFLDPAQWLDPPALPPLASEPQPLADVPPIDSHDGDSDSFDSDAHSDNTGAGNADSSAVPLSLFQQAARIRASGGPDGSGQSVVIIDTGIAADHVTLGGQDAFGPGYRVVGGWDFAENDAHPYDDGPAGFHGTHVASLLAGRVDDAADQIGRSLGDVHQGHGSGDSSSGISPNFNGGIAPNFSGGIAPGVDLISLRVFDDLGRSESQWVESALRWVHDQRVAFESPITTVNLSIGVQQTPESIASFQTAIADELALLAEHDILVFAAAGNQLGDATPLAYPAADANVVAVGAIDANGSLAAFSGRAEDLWAATGVDVRGAVPEHVNGWDGQADDIEAISGTSTATPQVAAASILVRQALGQAGLPADADAVMNWMRQHASVHAGPAGNVMQPDLEATLAAIANASKSPPYQGDAGNDRIELDLASEDWSIRDLRDPDAITRVAASQDVHSESPGYQIDGGDGGDEIRILASDGAERVILRAGGVSEVLVGGRRLELLGFERIEFVGDASDRVTLFDSPGDDILHSQVDHTTLTGIGFEFEVSGTREVYAYGTAGGTDQAIVRDTAQDDRWTIRPEFTSLRTETPNEGDGQTNGDTQAGGEDRFRMAFGFEQVQAFASLGGADEVKIYDSPGDDTVSMSGQQIVLAGLDYRVSARGFDRVHAYASGLGNDQLRLYVDDVDALQAQWDGVSNTNEQPATLGMRTLDGDEYRAEGFESAAAFEDYQPIDFDRWLDEQHSDLSELFDLLGP